MTWWRVPLDVYLTWWGVPLDVYLTWWGVPLDVYLTWWGVPLDVYLTWWGVPLDVYLTWWGVPLDVYLHLRWEVDRQFDGAAHGEEHGVGGGTLQQRPVQHLHPVTPLKRQYQRNFLPLEFSTSNYP
jgi:hypothetical protein